MASQVLHWTIQIVRKLRPQRKSKEKKATPVRETSISRPSLRRPAGPYSQRRAEVEPLPYPWAEIDHGRQSAQNGLATHHYPHIYYQDGQYHTVRWPPLSSSPTPPSRGSSPVSSSKSAPLKAAQRSLTYPAGSPHSRTGRFEVWWAGANQPSMHSQAQSQHLWNGMSSPHPGGAQTHSIPRPTREPLRTVAPPIPKTATPKSTHFPSRRNATPGTSRIPLHRNATPGPSRFPESEREALLPVTHKHDRNDCRDGDSRPHKKKKHKYPDKHKPKPKGKRQAAPKDPLDFAPGTTPPAVQQHLRAVDAEREEELRRKQEEYQPTAQLCAHDGFWLRQYEVDPRDPPPDFPYEKYLEMRKAECERERRLRKRRQENEEKMLALDLQSGQQSSSRWPIPWIRNFFRSKTSSS